MERAVEWRLLEAARVGVLGTLQSDGSPHLVPCVFAIRDCSIYLPVDAKPKRTRSLRRVQNLERNPAATLLVQEWDEDWTRLSWVRLDGRARVVTSPDELGVARRLLLARYAQYQVPEELYPMIALDVERWRAWRARE